MSSLRFCRFPAPLSLAVCLLLSGCLSPAGKVPDESTVGAQSSQYWKALASQLPAMTTAEVPDQWWSVFNDPLLNRLEQNAGQNNPDIQLAATHVEQSAAMAGMAASALYPQVSVNGSETRSALSADSPYARLGAPDSSYELWQYGMQASWEVDLWGHLRQLRNAAAENVMASQYGKDMVQVSVSSDVARQYILLRELDARQKVLQENQKIAEDMLKIAESRQRNGVATMNEQASASADDQQIDAELIALQQQKNLLMNALALLAGQPPHQLDNQLSSAPLPAMPANIPAGIPSELAQRRPDILQAEAQLRAAIADTQAAKADFYPRIGLNAEAGFQSYSFSGLGEPHNRFYGLGPTLYLPIFQGGRLKSQLALSKASQKAAALNYHKTVLQAWHEVINALDEWNSQQLQYPRLVAAEQQNRIALQVAERSWQQGAGEFSDVLIARRGLLQSQLAVTQCAAAGELALVALYRSLGGGWQAGLNQQRHPS